MGYCLNCLDEPVLIAVSKPLLTEFGIHHRLESCVFYWWESDWRALWIWRPLWLVVLQCDMMLYKSAIYGGKGCKHRVLTTSWPQLWIVMILLLFCWYFWKKRRKFLFADFSWFSLVAKGSSALRCIEVVHKIHSKMGQNSFLSVLNISVVYR